MENDLNQKREELLYQKKVLKELTGKPTIDKPWLKFYDEIFKEEDIPNKSIYQLAYESNKDNMNNIALDVRTSQNDYKMGVKITYKKFFEWINQNAKASTSIDIKTNDIIPIILPNVPEARTLIYSNSIIGAISFPISPLMPVKQLESIINDNKIQNLFVFNQFIDKYQEALKNPNLKNVIILDGTECMPKTLKMLNKVKDLLVNKKGNTISLINDKFIPWSEYLEYGKNMTDLKPFYENDHIAAIIGTSGTTGLSKGACLTDRNINAAGLSYKNGKLFEGNFLDALLPSIGYGLSMIHYQTIDGRYVYLIPELLTTNTSKAVCTLKPDNFPGGPVHYINILESKEYQEGKIPPHKNFISGGASLPHSVESTLNGIDEGYIEKGIEDSIFVRQGYGLSENVARGTYSKRGTYKFGSIGIPMMYDTISIFKPDTDEELGYNEIGEICITGPSVMKGYLNNEAETNKVIKIHSDGKRWIHTQDIGYMDEDGRISHVDRIKNIFMRTGFNVHPAKISEFINDIPFVRNAYVIGFNHPKEQCVPVAFIELDNEEVIKKGKETLIEEIKKLCYANLEETSVPYEYIPVDTLPINLGGKIDKLALIKESEIDYTKNPKSLKRELKFIK